MKKIIQVVIFIIIIGIIFANKTKQSIHIEDIGTDGEILMEYNYLTGKESYNLAENVAAYFQWCQDRGYNIFIGIEFFYIGSPSPYFEPATIWFNSPTLLSKGYSLEEDVLRVVIDEAKKRDLSIYVNIELLAHANFDIEPHDPNLKFLTTQDIKQVIQELYDYGVKGILEEAFPDEYVQAIWEKTRELGMEYFHYFDEWRGYADVFVSEDYHFYPSTRAEVEKLEPIGTLGSTIGNLNVMFGHAQALGVPARVGVAGNWGWKPGMQNNVTIYRMVGFDPDGFSYYSADETDYRWVEKNYTGELIQNLYQEFGKDYNPRPLANLIINLPFAKEETYYSLDYAISAFDVLTNTLTAAGYDLYVTYDQPYNSSDVETYIILTYGENKDEELFHNISSEIVNLFSSGKKVLLVTIAGIPRNTANWRSVRQALGIPQEQDFDYAIDWEIINNILPLTITYQNKTVQYSGLDMWQAGSYADKIPPRAVRGEVLLSGNIDGRNSALLIKNGNNYFLNGHPIHLDMTFVLANLLKPDVLSVPFNEPTFSYVSRGEITTILAGKDTHINMNLPITNNTVKLVEYNDIGQRIVDDPTYYFSNPFIYSLKKWHLLIIDGTGTKKKLGRKRR
ncbi:MAG: hypothetical protein ACE5WD_08595 [Candidatus Aminicenantia bacterium]